MWFEKLTGFRERSYKEVQNNLKVEGERLISKINSKEYQIGKLQISTLDELKKIAPPLLTFNSSLSFSEIVEDVQNLHKDPKNEGAIFQVASQFNLLEMVGPEIMPENGVARYANDYTQGPACAIACGAATIYRNYFVEVNGQIGQTKSNQINCLEEVENSLNDNEIKLWEMKNGYVISNKNNLLKISEMINNLDSEKYQELKEKLKIGIQWNAEVTIGESSHRVNQIFCSALPVRYSQVSSEYWEDFARLILEATYEATFYTALINYDRTGKKELFLTLVGGGAFGNSLQWIFDAIENSILKFIRTPLDIKIVSYGQPNAKIDGLKKKVNFIKNSL